LPIPETGLGQAVAYGSVLSGVGALALAGYLRRHRGEAGANWFVLALATQALWCLSYGGALFVGDPTVRWALEALAWIGTFWTGPLFLAFALEYTGRGTLLRSWLFAPVFGVPALTTVLVLTTRSHGLVWSEFAVSTVWGLSVATYTIEPWGFFAVVAGTVCAGVGVLLLIETVLSYGPLYRREAAAVALSTIPPSVGLVLWLFRVGPVPSLNLAPVLFLVHIALDGYAFVESGMFETNPTTRRAAERSVIDDIESPVFVLDTDHRIVEVNDDAAATFDLDPSAVLGTGIGTVVAVDVDATGDQQTVATRTGGRVREFAAVVSALTDPAEAVVGYTVVMQDVTDRRQREQRLSVLNRVLRHNLRNDMNVVTGRADLIAAESDSESVRESAAVIVERAEALQDISERAHEFERVTESGLHTRQVDAAALIDDLLADVRERTPDTEITVESDGATTVRTDPDVLELALSNLLDYALETDDDGPPRLSLTVGDADDGETFVVTVTDDGRGIARSELDPVELGRETDLQHATGIALWVVAWSVTALGGDIAFSESGDGTAVSVRLPRNAAAGEL